MFGLSLAKLAVLIGVIGAVIAGFRYAARIKAFQQRQEQTRVKEAAAAAARRAQPKPPTATKNVDTRQCPGCGTYIPAGYATCGRAECNAAA
jgi:hypothetical protein